MAIVPAEVIPAPQPRGLRYGLLTAATGPLELPAPAGLGGGVRYAPDSCGQARTYPIDCPADATPPTKTFDPIEDLIDGEPFLVYSSLQCGSVGYTQAELEARVRRRFASGEQTAVETQMAAILAAGAVPLTAPDPGSIESVVGELQEWLYGVGGANYGHVGYLHAPVRVQAYAAFAGLLLADGPLWKTQMGTIWVFGGGYPDTGTIYISGQVTLWRATDVFVPPVDQTFDRSLNQYKLLAEREYAAAYDCVAASAQFTAAVGAS
jgi:hypothetical protein